MQLTPFRGSDGNDFEWWKEKIHHKFKEELPENTKLILKDFAFHKKTNMTKVVQQA
jgi:hypothetical protein